MFAIDISHKAVANGVTIAAIRAVRRALAKLRQMESLFPPSSTSTTGAGATAESAMNSTSQAAYSFAAKSKPTAGSAVNKEAKSKAPPRIRAAIVTFDASVQFYTINMQSPDPIKMFVCSAEDPLCPLPPAHWLYQVTDAESALEHLLQRIPELIASMQESSGYGGGDCFAGGDYGYGSGFTPTATPTSRAAGGGKQGRPMSGAYDMNR